MHQAAYYAITALVALVAGVGLGRIKNKAKLAAIQAYVNQLEADLASGAKKVEAEAKAELSTLISDLKKKL